MAGTPTMSCGGCGRTGAWKSFGRCSWTCFDQARATEAEQQAMLDAATEAFAFHAGLAPGTATDDDR